MEIIIFIKIFLIFSFLFFCAFFSGSEVALFSLGTLRLQRMKEEKHPSASAIERLLDSPRRLLISLLIGNEIGNIVASSIAAPIFISYLGKQGEWIAIITMTLIIIFFCDIVPKSLCISYPEKVSSIIVRPITIFVRFITPLRWAINQLVDSLLSFLTLKRDPRENIYCEAEIKDLVDLGHREGSLEETERNLIHRIFRMGDTRVSKIMTPRKEMFTLPLELGFENLISQVKEGHYSRIPIFSGNRNNIVGILNAKDLLPFVKGGGNQIFDLSKMLRKPLFVSPDKRIDDLLRELQRKKIHMAVIINEQEKVVGLVTMEDILEEIFGEIYDEYDQ